jgi:hypothetical protein
VLSSRLLQLCALVPSNRPPLLRLVSNRVFCFEFEFNSI